jgi:cell division protein FtsB
MKIASITTVLKLSRIIGLAICMAFPAPAVAQQATNSASPDDANQQLLRRIDQLEAKVKQLEEKQAAPPPAAPAPVP